MGYQCLVAAIRTYPGFRGSLVCEWARWLRLIGSEKIALRGLATAAAAGC